MKKEKKIRGIGTKEKEALRKSVRNLAVKIAGGCTVQSGEDGQTYPCGTCFNAGLGNLVNEKSADYKRHNDKVDNNGKGLHIFKS